MVLEQQRTAAGREVKRLRWERALSENLVIQPFFSRRNQKITEK
jgi:hypothetical protein